MNASTLDRTVMCPMCHQTGGLPSPAMDRFEMRSCPACGGRWAVCTPDAIPDYDAAYRSERRVYRRYEAERRHVQTGGEPPIYWFQRRQLERIRPFGERRLLEIGCGVGTFLLAARRAGWDAVGLEVSSRIAGLATQLSGCRVHIGDVGSLATPLEGFEVISAFEVLEHLFDPFDQVRQIAAALRPGGYLTLSVPNDRSPYVRNPADPEGRPPYHINYFQRRTIVTCLEKAGLQPVWVYEKPFAWSEAHPSVWRRWVMLPWLVFAGYALGRKGSRLVAWARKPGGAC